MNKNLITTIIFALMITIVSNVSMADESGDIPDSFKDGYNAGYSEGYNDGMEEAKSKNPVIKVDDDNKSIELDAGQEHEFTITFKNTSKYPAKNFVITPLIDECEVLIYERPIVLNHEESVKMNKTFDIKFNAKVSDDARIGTYKLRFRLDYKNNFDESFTKEALTYIKIVSEKVKPIVNISNIKNSKSNLSYDDRFNTSFDIQNIGGNVARDVEVKLTGFDNNAIMPVDSLDYYYLGDLESGKKINRSFPLVISPNIETPDNTITATITFKDNSNKEYSFEKKIYIVGVKVKEKSGDKKDEKEEEKKEEIKYAKPKVIISSYNLSSSNISAGESFKFSYNFKNTSKDKDIRNIKVTISSEEGAFVINKGSNTFYVESMGKNTILSNSISLMAKQSLKSNSYAIYVEFEYEDYDGNEYTSKEAINVPVTEFSKLVLNSVNVEDAFVGSPVSISFDYANMGKATVSNLSAKLSGDYKPQSDVTYIGNLEAGTSDYYDIEAVSTKEGLNRGEVILTFEDSSGKVMRVSKSFVGNVLMEEATEITDMPEIEGPVIEEETSFENWQLILIGIGSFLVTAIIIRSITKKIMMKKFENDI